MIFKSITQASVCIETFLFGTFIVVVLLFLKEGLGSVSNKLHDWTPPSSRAYSTESSDEEKPRTISNENGRTEVTKDENQQYTVEVYNFITHERHTLKDPSRKGLEIKINQMFKEMLEREEALLSQRKNDFEK